MAWGWISDNVTEVKTVAGAFPDNIAGHAEEGHLRALCAAFGQKVLGTDVLPGRDDRLQRHRDHADRARRRAAYDRLRRSGSDWLYYKSLVDAGFTGKSYRTDLHPGPVARVVPMENVESIASAWLESTCRPHPRRPQLKDLWTRNMANGLPGNPTSRTGISSWPHSRRPGRSTASRRPHPHGHGVRKCERRGQDRASTRHEEPAGVDACATLHEPDHEREGQGRGRGQLQPGQAYLNRATAKPPG